MIVVVASDCLLICLYVLAGLLNLGLHEFFWKRYAYGTRQSQLDFRGDLSVSK